MHGILIMEDHPLVSEPTRSLLLSMTAEDIVLCESAEEAIARLNRPTHWFRIFLDISIPGAVGLSLARHVHQSGNAQRCAIITASDNYQWREEAKALGFLGYVVKTADLDDFHFSMRQILGGSSYFYESDPQESPTALTRRQVEILECLHEGMPTKRIANRLKLSPGTVDNHVSAILRALRANDRAHAVAKGVQLGYVGHSLKAALPFSPLR